jgi:hypothetical protein
MISEEATLPPRPTPLRRAWPSIVALGVAMSLPAHAQDAAAPQPGALGLRDSEGGVSVVTPPLAVNLSDQVQTDPEEPRKPAPPKKPAPTRLIKRVRPASLVLEPYPKAQRAGAPGGPPALDPARAPPPTIAAVPTILPKHRPRVEDKPFDPVGIELGDLRLLPTIEEDVGYASNPSQLPGKTKASLYESTQGGLAFQSDWARNDFQGAFTGGYADYFTAHQADSPNASALVGGRLDASRDLAFDGEGRFNLATQTPGSVTLPTGIALQSTARPLVETFGAALGATQKFGDLALSLHGTLDSTVYQNATLADGSTEDLSSDNNNDWGLRARVAYQISPIIAPFVEGVVDTRRYDQPVDFTGFARSSNGVLGRAGATLALSGQLTGVASLGYGVRQYQDPRLPNLQAPLIDAALIWTATPLTTVTLKTTTTLADTNNAGASGAVSRSYTIDVSHQLLRNLTLGANAGYATDVYAGAPLRDSTTTFGAHADYNITRDIILRASANHSQYASNAPGSNYVANVFMLGLKLQR